MSFTGSITFKNAKKFAEIVRAVPLDRILVETDCPYLTPEPHRGETNYPKYVRAVAEKIAGYKGIEFSEVERATRENTRRLFYKMK
ncbi:MAG: TatD family hydrolase [Christensenellales bacterium]